MKKALLIIMLLQGMAGGMFAQTTPYGMSKTEAAFNIGKNRIRNRHIVSLEKENKMLIELYSIKNYSLLGDLDTILRHFVKDIAFYKDSLEALSTENIRIDYTLSLSSANSKVRFKIYPADGSAFINKKNETSKLKLEQDTIHILVSKESTNGKPYNHGPHGSLLNFNSDSTAQVIFLLNNYTDIFNLAATKEVKNIMDSLIEKSGYRTPLKKGQNDQSTIYYNPYSPEPNFVKRYMLLDYPNHPEDILLNATKGYDYLTANLDLGAGLIKNKIAPVFSAGPEFKIAWKGWNTAWNPGKEYTVYGLNATAYYLFDKQSDGKYKTNINWFVNAEYGSIYSRKSNKSLSRSTFGLGYLINPDNTHFQKNTFRFFYNVGFSNGLRVLPEVIFTNNFKNIFPGITISFSCFNNNN